MPLRRDATRPTRTRAAAAVAAAMCISMLALSGCGRQQEQQGKLLISDKVKVSATEFLLARAHDFDRVCETLYLKVPVRALLHDATDETRRAFAAVEDVQATPTKLRRWDYVLMHNRHDPQSYESIFIGEWRPFSRREGADRPATALLAPVRCVVTMSTVEIFELEPPFAQAAGNGDSKRSAAIVAKYTRVAPDVGLSVEQRTQALATSDKANVGEAAALSIIIKEEDSHAAPVASGSSSRQ